MLKNEHKRSISEDIVHFAESCLLSDWDPSLKPEDISEEEWQERQRELEEVVERFIASDLFRKATKEEI